MKFYKASLLSFLIVFLLSTAKTAAATIRSKKDEKTSSFEGFSSEVITSFISLFSSSQPSKTSTSSCYDFTMNIETDRTPEGISWEIENKNTGEIIASQEEGFYTEAYTLYTHNETICLDMDNSDVCYKVVVRDTNEDTDYTSTETKLFHITEDPVDDEYSKGTYGRETYTVCKFSDFWYANAGCFVSPSCECGDTAYCGFDAISLVFYAIFVVVCCPCIAVNLVFTYAILMFYFYIFFGTNPLEFLLGFLF